VDKQWVFDSGPTREYTEVRQQVVGWLLTAVKDKVVLGSALDLGCGVGHFSKFLSESGLSTVAVDGREENVIEARRRFPEISFITRNAEDPSLTEIGIFDFVLCVGLIYHLENPFRTIRSLHALTRKILFVEGMIAPGKKPSLLLVDESSEEDQGLNHIAFYPTETCLAKMLYRAGFQYVYGFRRVPDHPLFKSSLWRRKERSMFVASREQLDIPEMCLQPNERSSWELLGTCRERAHTLLNRFVGYMPWRHAAAQGEIAQAARSERPSELATGVGKPLTRSATGFRR
jgi:SAM-dependent methyltransferase